MWFVGPDRIASVPGHNGFIGFVLNIDIDKTDCPANTPNFGYGNQSVRGREAQIVGAEI